MRILAAAGLLAALGAAPDLAKDGAKVVAAESDMNAAYATLLGKLSGAPKLHLEHDQERWLANRRACDFNAALKDGCLEARYQTRAAKLRLFADGLYPFISEQAIVKSGKLEHGVYAIDASYPQFDSPTADFSAVNRGFADQARQSADDVLQSGFDAGYDQTFDLYRLNSDVVSVWIHGETWQANLRISNTGTLVDLRTGQLVGLLEFQTTVEEVFDVQVLPGIVMPYLSGPWTERDVGQPFWTIPPARS